MGHRPRETVHDRGIGNRHGCLRPGSDIGGLRWHQHGYRASPFLLNPTADWRPLAGVRGNSTAFLLRPSISVPDGSLALRFAVAGIIVQAMGGSTKQELGGGEVSVVSAESH